MQISQSIQPNFLNPSVLNPPLKNPLPTQTADMISFSGKGKRPAGKAAGILMSLILGLTACGADSQKALSKALDTGCETTQCEVDALTDLIEGEAVTLNAETRIDLNVDNQAAALVTLAENKDATFNERLNPILAFLNADISNRELNSAEVETLYSSAADAIGIIRDQLDPELYDELNLLLRQVQMNVPHADIRYQSGTYDAGGKNDSNGEWIPPYQHHYSNSFYQLRRPPQLDPALSALQAWLEANPLVINNISQGG